MNSKLRSALAHEMHRQNKYVLYWMQQAQRVHYNLALQTAMNEANALKLPLLVAFVVMPNIPEANQRHFRFMAEGVVETMNELRKWGIGMLVMQGDPAELIPKVCMNAVSVFTDLGYLRWQGEIRNQVAANLHKANLDLNVIETEAVVPVEIASGKEEYSAATLRRKICNHILDFEHNFALATIHQAIDWQDMKSTVSTSYTLATNADPISLGHLWQCIVDTINHDTSVSCVNSFAGGYTEALTRLNHFILNSLQDYSAERSDPGKGIQSNLSPYLHFGQISPHQTIEGICSAWNCSWQYLPLLIQSRKNLAGMDRNIADFLEELIIRRELSFNFCHYNPDYDSYLSVPLWARQSLATHIFDRRKYHYCLDNLEQGNTHDIYWNRAQAEMLEHGKMHNYMRMYWGKKIIEWSDNPEEAYYTMLYLNNKYELDGRDANAYAGVAWCFGKHDRAWQERPILGKVRYMNARGLERKFQMEEYLKNNKEFYLC
ncbi:MAG: deoxyribodipyrimidine photolyase [Candidatus Cloacimonetes bacterium HGW-Cloacimonetes-1]|jgi:deoxyribodipyrimidine photo-lyase|nr:MAG: deoxyribodipyrimidine photolyase [Candidatus Cloacimonetes bacterium HGW-Cloacimonetes-1]